MKRIRVELRPRELRTNRINFRKDYIRSSGKRRYPFPATVTFNPMAPGEI